MCDDCATVCTFCCEACCDNPTMCAYACLIASPRCYNRREYFVLHASRVPILNPNFILDHHVNVNVIINEKNVKKSNPPVTDQPTTSTRKYPAEELDERATHEPQ